MLKFTVSGGMDEIFDFYRKALAPLGWSLWSPNRNGPAPADSASSQPDKNGARAYYMQGPQIAELTAQHADDGRLNVKFAPMPEDDLRAMQRAFLSGDTIGATRVDVNLLPRLDGGTVDAKHSDANDVILFGRRRWLRITIAAHRRPFSSPMAGSLYAAPLERPEGTSLQFKKDGQGLDRVVHDEQRTRRPIAR